MYMTNEEWKQNNQDYLKESYEETGFTAGGYAVHKLICGDRKSTRLNSSHTRPSRMPSSA